MLFDYQTALDISDILNKKLNGYYNILQVQPDDPRINKSRLDLTWEIFPETWFSDVLLLVLDKL